MIQNQLKKEEENDSNSLWKLKKKKFFGEVIFLKYIKNWSQ